MKYQLFGTQSGLPVSQLIMGGAMLGNRSGYGSTYTDAIAMLSTYVNAGGNFIDIADLYQQGEAEEIVGKFVSKKRHDFILCTKYTRSALKEPAVANFGNHRKSMHQAIEGSLKRLGTDFIDIYMPHYDDGITPLEEIARGLEDLVKSGKILYAGLANFPAWKVAIIAKEIRLTALQYEYNLTQRASERELAPMAKHFGLGVMAYSPLAGGLLTGKYRKGSPGRLSASIGESDDDDRTNVTIDILETIAVETDSSLSQVALAWVLSKNVFPILGARTTEQLLPSLASIHLKLLQNHLSELDDASKIALEYPHELLQTVQKKY
ncbi:Predicted oxidoreductase [Olivibacter domesticus]|uniref:Predicted oxidoreductase n=2 Tax=Olivibacter domesticus TaxID=407022 RepID=A0A1H7GZQ7_OLID1|nr:Predicted oxidoreductase [Olivibacter domesticus]